MIKINLLGEEETTDSSGILVFYGYVASVVVCLLLYFFLYHSLSSSIDEMSRQKEDLEKEVARLKETTKEVKELEAKRNELNSKLAVIATLKKSKTGPVRILDDLNNSLPDRAWVTEVNEKAGVLTIDGFAIDNPTVSSFAKSLQSSSYYKNPEIEETKQTDRQGVSIQSFKVKSAISYAGHFESPKEEEKKDDKGEKKES